MSHVRRPASLASIRAATSLESWSVMSFSRMWCATLVALLLVLLLRAASLPASCAPP